MGKSEVSKLLFAVFNRFLNGFQIKTGFVNHQAALLYFEGETLRNCQVFELGDESVRNIYSVVDPKKLKSLVP
jgi:RNA polymerase sigma-70 factor (ECF subfamily)